MRAETIIEVHDLVKRFRMRRPAASDFLAVDRVSFHLQVGESLGLVGETGAGKSTIARCLLGLEAPSSGRIALFGFDTAKLGAGGWRTVRRNLQAVFQDPKGAMNPRWSVGELVGEPIRRLGDRPASRIADRVRTSLEAVGLGEEFFSRHRHQLSGGQQQRVNIARAIAVEPRCIVLDEPVAELDTAVKRDIVRLLADLQCKSNLAYLLISHDLRVVRILCQRVIVLFRGRIVEIGPADLVIGSPGHPYTRQLLAAQLTLPGETSSRARTDISEAAQIWSLENQDQVPGVGDLVEVGNGHYVAGEVR